MTMHIKNEETYRLAQELADLTGESLTEAVTQALRERLERCKHRKIREDRIEKILEIARETAAHFDPNFRSEDHAEMLYDDKGLPK